MGVSVNGVTEIERRAGVREQFPMACKWSSEYQFGILDQVLISIVVVIQYYLGHTVIIVA